MSIRTVVSGAGSDIVLDRTVHANADNIHFAVGSEEPPVLQLAQLADVIERDEAGRLCPSDSAAATAATTAALRHDRVVP